MDIASILDLIKNYGFPIAVAVWALWRLEKSWGSGTNIEVSLSGIEESLDRIELILTKNMEIQHELITTMKIIQTIIGGESRK